MFLGARIATGGRSSPSAAAWAGRLRSDLYYPLSCPSPCSLADMFNCFLTMRRSYNSPPHIAPSRSSRWKPHLPIPVPRPTTPQIPLPQDRARPRLRLRNPQLPSPRPPQMQTHLTRSLLSRGPRAAAGHFTSSQLARAMAKCAYGRSARPCLPRSRSRILRQMGRTRSGPRASSPSLTTTSACTVHVLTLPWCSSSFIHGFCCDEF